jgi:hypothetical protein
MSQCLARLRALEDAGKRERQAKTGMKIIREKVENG